MIALSYISTLPYRIAGHESAVAVWIRGGAGGGRYKEARQIEAGCVIDIGPVAA